MAQSITVEVITPDAIAAAVEASAVNLPTPNGQIGILPGHATLRTIISPGVITIRHHRTPDDTEYMAVAGGIADVNGKRIRLLVDAAERAETIDEQQAQRALAEARRLQREAADQVTLAEATGLIEQHLARLKVAGLRRQRKQKS